MVKKLDEHLNLASTEDILLWHHCTPLFVDIPLKEKVALLALGKQFRLMTVLMHAPQNYELGRDFGSSGDHR